MKDHDIWSYIRFIIHLKSIPEAELNGTESHILELFDKEDVSWFPMQRSGRLIKNKLKKEQIKKALLVEANKSADAGLLDKDPRKGMHLSLLALEEKVQVMNSYF